jgi:hypothetical protein
MGVAGRLISLSIENSRGYQGLSDVRISPLDRAVGERVAAQLEDEYEDIDANSIGHHD